MTAAEVVMDSAAALTAMRLVGTSSLILHSKAMTGTYKYMNKER